MSTLTRYTLFQIPGWVLASTVCGALWWAEILPAWAAGLLVALWVLKDAAMYPLVRKAYEATPTGSECLVGERGIARERLAPRGYVEVRGALWRAEVARGTRDVDPGEQVTVCGANGLTLFVSAAHVRRRGSG
jgi:membrane protein implicated in regulation of membrane protease activity